MNTSTNTFPAIVPLLFMVAVGGGTESGATEAVSLVKLRESTHIHGIAVDAKDPSRIYLATHHGLFVARADGRATPVSAENDDFMGFTPHPTDPTVLYASGHPARGGNLGFMTSIDGGKTWRQLSPGYGGPVDFHQMDVSKADPLIIYGVYGGLQLSKDSGRTWEMVGEVPDRLIDLAASAKDVERLYAATERGLMITLDRGRTWQSAYMYRDPATMVHTTTRGEVYAFVIGRGLIRGTEPGLRWATLSKDFGEQFMLHLAVDPTNANKLYAVTGRGDILTSKDSGRTWTAFGVR